MSLGLLYCQKGAGKVGKVPFFGNSGGNIPKPPNTGIQRAGMSQKARFQGFSSRSQDFSPKYRILLLVPLFPPNPAFFPCEILGYFHPTSRDISHPIPGYFPPNLVIFFPKSGGDFPRIPGHFPPNPRIFPPTSRGIFPQSQGYSPQIWGYSPPNP